MSLPILMTRRDPARNMARFYSLTIEESLFGDICLIRDWGRIGTSGRRVIELHASAKAAERRLEAIYEAKRRRGYAPRSN